MIIKIYDRYMLTNKYNKLDENTCIECGRMAEHTHHCLQGKWRKNCDKLGLTVRLCSRCHTLIHSHKGKNPLSEKYQELAQFTYEKCIGDKNKFFKIFKQYFYDKRDGYDFE